MHLQSVQSILVVRGQVTLASVLERDLHTILQESVQNIRAAPGMDLLVNVHRRRAQEENHINNILLVLIQVLHNRQILLQLLVLGQANNRSHNMTRQLSARKQQAAPGTGLSVNVLVHQALRNRRRPPLRRQVEEDPMIQPANVLNTPTVHGLEILASAEVFKGPKRQRN